MASANDIAAVRCQPYAPKNDPLPFALRCRLWTAVREIIDAERVDPTIEFWQSDTGHRFAEMCALAELFSNVGDELTLHAFIRERERGLTIEQLTHMLARRAAPLLKEVSHG